jgi:hypothetical protein
MNARGYQGILQHLDGIFLGHFLGLLLHD